MVLLQGRYAPNKKLFNCSLALCSAIPQPSCCGRRTEVLPLSLSLLQGREGRNELGSQQRQDLKHG